MTDTNPETPETPEATPPPEAPETTPEAPETTTEDPTAITDGITAWAVYNTELGQFVGGVVRGKKPTAKEAKATLEAYGQADSPHEVRQV